MIRLNRARDSLKQIPFLERQEYAFIDLEYLARRVEGTPEIDSSVKKEIYGNLISLYEKTGREEESEKLKDILQRKL